MKNFAIVTASLSLGDDVEVIIEAEFSGPPFSVK